MHSSHSSIGISRRLASSLLLALLAVTWALPAVADVCVWRDPDKTMSKLFPEARDYLTITKRMTAEAEGRIEKQLGAPLDDSEKGEFNFYDLRARRDGKAVSVGTAIALAGKGEYGVIEVVIGLGREGAIRSVYIQRSREKANNVIRSEAFLRQFVGKTVRDPLQFGKDLKAPEGGGTAAETVRVVVRKMLLFNKELANAPDAEPATTKGG